MADTIPLVKKMPFEIFGMASDKVCKDTIACDSRLTFKQVCDLTKVDESTNVQMEIISKGDEKSNL